MLEGPLDEALLKGAFQRIIDRHEALRTTFYGVGGLSEMFQVISKHSAPHWQVDNISEYLPDRQESILRELAQCELGHPFDLEGGPMVRVRLLELLRRKRIMVITLPALLADSVTIANSVDELGRFYSARLGGGGHAGEVIQYLQFSEWQNALLEDEDAQTGKAFWRDQGLNLSEPVVLPFERRLPEQAPFSPATVTAPISSEVWAQIRTLCRSEGLESEAFLLACWQTLIWRLSGRPEIVVGKVFDGRKYDDLKGVFGLLSRTLPLSFRFEGRQQLLDVWRKTRQCALDASDWQEYFPLDTAAAAAVAAMSDGFGFESNVNPGGFRAGDLTFSIRRIHTCQESFKVKLVCVEYEEGLSAEFHYDGARYSTNDIERLAGQFAALLSSAARDVRAPVDELEIVSEGEKKFLLAEFNNTRTECLPDRCLHHLFEEQVEKTPNADAVVFGQVHLSYQDLNRRANQLAHHLQSLGVGPEVIVGVFLERSPQLVIAILAALKAGGCYLPIDPVYPADRIAFMLEDAGVPVLLTEERLSSRLPQLEARTVYLDTSGESLTKLSDDTPPSRLAADNLAYVIYTSGSTGRPKGVMITHRGLVNYLAWCAPKYGAARGCGSPVHSSIGFDLTVTSLFSPLLAGRGVWLLPELRGIETLSGALRDQYNFSLVKITPTHLDALNHRMIAGETAGCIGSLVIGGEELRLESLSHWRMRSPGTRLFNEYGPTETVVGCSVYEIPTDAPQSGAAPIGRPIANTQIYILDAAMRLVPFGGAGELYVGGAGVARGYLGRAELTAEKFVPNPFGDLPGERLYRTGDLARFLADGDLEYLGRVDDQVKIRGHRVELGEIEASLKKHPSIIDAAVIARVADAEPRNCLLGGDGEAAPAVRSLRRFTKYDDRNSNHLESGAAGGGSSAEKRLIAYIVCHDKAAPTAMNLRSFLSATLPDYMLPSAFVTLERLPTTANGKLDRQALPAPKRARPELGRPATPPITETEKILAAIWANVLGVSQPGVHDNFFELGGDSIRSLQVAARAQEEGLALTIEQLFEHPTISELAEELGPVEKGNAARRKVEPFELISDDDRLKLFADPPADLPADLEDAYPLARIQAGVLFHSEHSPDSPLYHDIFTYHIQAPLDPERFDSALKQVIARHAVLRTSFDLTRFSEPLQLAHRAATVSLRVTDLRHFPPERQEQEFEAWVEEEKRHRFDWANPPLVRFFAHRLTDQTFYLTLSFHDSIIDGWSTASLLTELLRRYIASLAGVGVSTEPRPPIHYRDFVALEREALASEGPRDYWANKLVDCVIARLPRRNGAAADAEHRIGVVDVPIPADVSDGLKRLARLAGVPIKHVLLTAHIKTMSVICGQRDLLTGLESNGRLEERGGEEALGIHLNTLPFRFKLRSGTWVDLAREVFEAERETLPFRRYPYSQIQKVHGGESLFETIFNYTHFHVFDYLRDLPGLKVLGGRGFGQRHYALSAEFNRDPVTDRVQLDLECDLNVLSEEQWEGVGGYYARTLAAMAHDPQGRHEQESFVSDGERRLIFDEWNKTAVDYPDDRCVHELFEEQVLKTPGAIAVDDGTNALSYSELNIRANQIAYALRERGVGAESLVGIYVERSAELIAAILGVLKAGGAYLPLDTAYPRDRIAFMLADANVQVLLTHRRLAWQAPESGAETLYLDSERESLKQHRRENLQMAIPSGSPAYVIYTSGSSGSPKGVVVSHQNLLHSILARGIYYRDTIRGFLMVSSPAFDSSVAGIFWTLCRGGALVLPAEGSHQDLQHISDLVANKRISHLLCVPSLYGLLLESADAERLRGLISVIVAGEVCPGELIERHRRKLPQTGLFNEYGPTEATVWSSVYDCRDHNGAASAPIGRPISNARIYILDSFLQPAPLGVTGELFISGAGVARGYLNRPELTAEKFIPDPFIDRPGARMYRTGDLARFRPDGIIEFVGRMDQQVKMRGYRIELGEIEFVLKGHHAVLDAAVTVIDQEGAGKRIVAYVVYVEGSSTRGGELRDFLKTKLPDYMIPHIFLQLDSLPRTPNGKLDRRRLPEPGAVLNEREKVARILARLRQISDEDADKEAKALLAPRRMSI